MQNQNMYLATAPFDLYELHLFSLVATRGSFSQAAVAAGLTQSAISRQIQALEHKLGTAVFERTTRKVSLTPAGQFLLERSRRIVGDVESTLRHIQEDFASAPKQLRVGVSATVSLAYLPGFFVAQQRARPDVRLTIAHEDSTAVLAGLENGAYDAGVICPPPRLPRALRITHSFDDAFILVTPKTATPPPAPHLRCAKEWCRWCGGQRWLLISEKSNTGRNLRQWMAAQKWRPDLVTEVDNFDLIISLVAMGLGVSLVPRRALALYGRRRALQRFLTPRRFKRKLVVVARRVPRLAPHVQEFLKEILF